MAFRHIPLSLHHDLFLSNDYILYDALSLAIYISHFELRTNVPETNGENKNRILIEIELELIHSLTHTLAPSSVLKLNITLFTHSLFHSHVESHRHRRRFFFPMFAFR